VYLRTASVYMFVSVSVHESMSALLSMSVSMPVSVLVSNMFDIVSGR